MANTENDSAGTGRKPKWTVMVYMAAEKSPELDAVAVEDLKEMERGVNDNVSVAVQINRAWPTVPQRYRIRSSRNATGGLSEFVGVDPEGTNMGAGSTLARFLTWAVGEFPAEHYCLVLWGHAYGLGFGRDHNDPLRLDELRDALQAFRTERQKLYAAGGESNGQLELLGANACAMSYVEAAYELRDQAEYLVASQIAVPLAGWPYKTILSRITDQTRPENLGGLVVDAYVSHYNALLTGERVSMSPLKLEKADILQGLLQDMTRAIRAETSPGGQFSSAGLDHVRDVFIAAASGDVRPLIDLRHLCRGFNGAACEALKRLSADVPDMLEKLVVHHAAHPDLDDLSGLGIFAPFVTDEQDLRRLGLQDPETDATSSESSKGPDRKKTGKEEYAALSIFQGTKVEWPSLVYDELRREIPAEVMTYLTGIGATKREDRRDVTQIVLSIDSSFNKLDRVLADAKACIGKKLRGTQRGGPADDTRELPANRSTKRFGPPWLNLIRPPSLEARVTTLKHLRALRELQPAAEAVSGTTSYEAKVSDKSVDPVKADIELLVSRPESVRPVEPSDTDVVDSVVDFFDKVEKSVGEVERAVRKGLTNAKFGLGPAAPGQFSVGEPIRLGDSGEQPKSQLGDSGEQPKSQLGDSGEQPKSQLGPSHQGAAVAFTGDLRVDLAFARVVELFRQVGQALQRLEQATLEVEVTARDMLSDAQVQGLDRKDLLLAASREIERGFRILQEASTNARRTVRRVLSHPVYGVGPASGIVGIEERQALASAGGLDRRDLRLL